MGSNFWFSVTLPQAEAPHAEAAAVSPARDPATGATILLVEDLEINRDLARRVLEMAGHAVDCVTDGAAALAAVQARTYDLVFMDIQMPGMDGLTATRLIRALATPARDTPIVAMSANVLPAQVAAAKAAGMEGHVGKPFKRAELQAAIEQWRRPSDGNAIATHPDVSGATADAILDQDAYAAIIDLIGGARMQHLLAELRTLTQDRLNAALSTPDDRETVAAGAHDLVSASGMLGFARLSRACRALQHACEEDRSLAPFLAAFAAASTEALTTIEDLKRVA